MHRPSLFSAVLATGLTAAGVFALWARGAPERQLAEAEVRWGVAIQPGDLVFQDLDCGLRCELIREVTHSRYAHVGVVLDERGERVVWEALGPVGPTPLAKWLHRGRGHDVAVYRPTGRLARGLDAIAREVRTMRGLPYDSDYQWDDERIYCSELYAKAVRRATGEEHFPPHALGPGAFGRHAGTIQRLSKGKLTEQTLMVSPLDLARSGDLARLVDELAE